MDFVQKKLGMFSIPYYPPFRRGYALAYLAYTAAPPMPSLACPPLHSLPSPVSPSPTLNAGGPGVLPREIFKIPNACRCVLLLSGDLYLVIFITCFM